MKKILNTLINKETWDSSDQQHSGKALAEKLYCLNESGSNGPFIFSRFRTHSRMSYTSCSDVTFSEVPIQNL